MQFFIRRVSKYAEVKVSIDRTIHDLGLLGRDEIESLLGELESTVEALKGELDRIPDHETT